MNASDRLSYYMDSSKLTFDKLQYQLWLNINFVLCRNLQYKFISGVCKAVTIYVAFYTYIVTSQQAMPSRSLQFKSAP